MKIFLLLLVSISLFFLNSTFAEKTHKEGDEHHHENENDSDHSEHTDYDKKEGKHKQDEAQEKTHDHKHEDSDHEEENSQVGPGKGILEANENQGIRLAPQVEINFEIKKIKWNGKAPLEVPKSAIVTSGMEVNVYRFREGFYKRIDFKEIKKEKNNITISSVDLSAGDDVVTQGTGFLRIAEIAAFGGAPEGHSH
ncbi:MAG: hypothetical protein L6Q37_05295 [Bdellovibrionaceae bacterium]|nr:hypothetical protein [Pseudobdellovibrionaceae bacterium]NUM58648.1 hypothetical protein [Pseudobdellovibrionaceae bacterium]